MKRLFLLLPFLLCCLLSHAQPEVIVPPKPKPTTTQPSKPVKPSKPKPTTGTLKITSSPSDAVVKIDGEYMGTTPLTLKKYKAGTYRITFSAEGYKTKTQSVTVTAGKTTNCDVILSRIPSEDAEIEGKTPEQIRAMAYNYRHGTGGKSVDYTKAMKYCRIAAERGNADAMNDIGVMYEKGQGVTKDYAEAVKWYRKAAEQGLDWGQNNLGYMYRYGYGVTKDYEEAVKWYRKAAEQGLAMGQSNLGTMYEMGYGVTKDYEEAVKWYRKAAEQGNAIAQYNLGVCYQYGKGVTIDLTQAKYWYEKAAEQGDEDAKERLKDL